MKSHILSDRVLGGIVVLCAITLAWLSYNIKINPNQLTLSARFFPLLLSAVLFCLGGVLCFKPGPITLDKTMRKVSNIRGGVVAILVLLYFVNFRHLDFRIGAWLFMLLSMWALGARNIWELVLIPPFVSGVIYIIFRYGFNTLLPVWI